MKNNSDEKLEHLLSSIKIEKLPGYTRGEYPAKSYRDEVTWSPNGKHWALAYTIFEATMCNDVGHLAWGSKNGDTLLFQTVVNLSLIHISEPTRPY